VVPFLYGNFVPSLCSSTETLFQAEGFAIFCCVATLIVVTYNIVSATAAKAVYNMYIVVILDILMVLVWLATMASLAALRAIFKIPVVVETFNEKRDVVAVATNRYLGTLVAAAVIAALEMYVTYSLTLL
jgi:hypothetical protein